jgi:hypothetical protein
MTSRVRTLQVLALSVALVLAFTLAPVALAAPTDHWVGTWAASPVSGVRSFPPVTVSEVTVTWPELYRSCEHHTRGAHEELEVRFIAGRPCKRRAGA